MFNLKKFRSIKFLFILILISGFQVNIASAQTPNPDDPIYIVQPGDYLSTIAAKLGVATDKIQQANNITDPNRLAAGDRLVVPGLEGIHGIIETKVVPLGDSYRSISRRFQIAPDMLTRINHITSPMELYAGVNLIVPQSETNAPLSNRTTLGEGQSLLEAAVLSNTSPWSIVEINQLGGSWDALPADVFYLPGDSKEDNGSFLAGVTSITVSPLPLQQGRTITIRIKTTEPLTLSGFIDDKPIDFFEESQNTYVSLQGIHAMKEPGVYPLKLKSDLPDGRSFEFEQLVILEGGNYLQDPPFTVPPEFIDPKVTEPELAHVLDMVAPKTPKRLWDGVFESPSPTPDCLTSRFGNRRSYNGSDFTYYHSGIDFCGGVGTKIFAPANGTVIFAGPVTVRGNMTLIDHGWGVYTGYFHQSEIDVKVGDQVEAGQEIGLVGETGRVTGGHLHWEIWVGGESVDPLDWLNDTFPAVEAP